MGATLALAMLSMAPQASAADKVPVKSFYIGLFAGGNLVLDDWDLHSTGDFGTSIGESPNNSSFIGGLRLGFHFHRFVALEVGLGFLPYTTWNDTTDLALSYTGDILLYPVEGPWVPFFDVGVGLYQNTGGTNGADTDTHYHYGVGLKGMLNDLLGLRLDVRHMMTDGYEVPRLAHNLELTLGLDIYAWTESHEPPPPKIVDSDGDGIQDKDDACPTTPGLPATKGCPDADGDGISDRDDACPAVPGSAALKGCPDADADGITDADDKCPDKAGPIDFEGCPDEDGDGIPIPEDRCPKEKGPKDKRGCPPPPVPKEVQEKFSGALEGIFFASGSAKIQKKSFPVLDEAAAVLLKFPKIKVRIEGHTDDRGRDDRNKKLSKARADSVRDYLVTKGVEKFRMTTEGFGEEKPIGDNKTKAGRAKNRRIEFHVVGNR